MHAHVHNKYHLNQIYNVMFNFIFRSKNVPYNLAANTAYGPAKSTELGSEYEDMKTGNEVYEEIPDKPPAENFDLATNVAYGPVQHSDTTTTSGDIYEEITHAAPAASLHPNDGEREYEAL